MRAHHERGLLNQDFCSWSTGDGGCGGYGLIQLMVPDPMEDLEMGGWPVPEDPPEEYLGLRSIQATILRYQKDPSFEKHYSNSLAQYFSRIEYTAVQVGTASWKRSTP